MRIFHPTIATRKTKHVLLLKYLNSLNEFTTIFTFIRVLGAMDDIGIFDLEMGSTSINNSLSPVDDCRVNNRQTQPHSILGLNQAVISQPRNNRKKHLKSRHASNSAPNSASSFLNDHNSFANMPHSINIRGKTFSEQEFHD